MYSHHNTPHLKITQLFTPHSLIFSLPHPHSLNPSSLTRSFPHPITPSLPHPITPSLPHPITPSLPLSLLTPSIPPHSLTPHFIAPLQAGDSIRVVSHVNDEWVRGELGGKEGILPADFVDHLPSNLPMEKEQKTSAADVKKVRPDLL